MNFEFYKQKYFEKVYLKLNLAQSTKQESPELFTIIHYFQQVEQLLSVAIKLQFCKRICGPFPIASLSLTYLAPCNSFTSQGMKLYFECHSLILNRPPNAVCLMVAASWCSAGVGGESGNETSSCSPGRVKGRRAAAAFTPSASLICHSYSSLRMTPATICNAKYAINHCETMQNVQ